VSERKTEKTGTGIANRFGRQRRAVTEYLPPDISSPSLTYVSLEITIAHIRPWSGSGFTVIGLLFTVTVDVIRAMAIAISRF